MSQQHPPSEELFAYRDGELELERRSLIEAHILSCTQCAARVEALSDAEGALRAGVAEPDGAYFDRLNDSVMRRVAEGAPPARAKAPRAPEPAPARRGRRRSFEDEPRGHAPGLPWAAILSTVSAGAAVIVVGIFLAQRQDAWRGAPEPGILGAPPDAASGDTPGDSPGASEDLSAAAPEAKRDEGEPAAPESGAEGRIDTQAQGAKEVATGSPPPAALEAPPLQAVRRAADQVPRAAGSGDVRTESAEEALPEVAERNAALQKKAEADANLARERAAAASPAAGLQTAPQSAVAGPTYADIVARHGLPPLYDPARVDPGALLRAETDLRYLYQNGGAGADSARARLYLAEAARARAGQDLDAETYDAIVHHYQRALRLAKDPETWRVAKKRLEDFVSRSAPTR